MKVGDLVRFVYKPCTQWGVGIILEERSIGGFHAFFPQINDWFAICDEHFPSDRVEIISASR